VLVILNILSLNLVNSTIKSKLIQPIFWAFPLKKRAGFSLQVLAIAVGYPLQSLTRAELIIKNKFKKKASSDEEAF
jgi:hypothetical protein